jgi:protein-L-isoaspartate(D-aspartate) O-methyltransferase
VTTDPRLAQLMMELRRGGVTDKRVLDALEKTPRGMFLADHFRERAYDNVALPIGHHQTASQPAVVARMTEALEIGERAKVLEIGTGCGYHAAVLARLCRRLYTMERHAPLLRGAADRFKRLGLVNITTLVADGTRGWPEQAPFDRIIVTAAAADVPSILLEQLSPNGVMVIPVGLDENDQYLLKVRRTGSEVETEDMGPTRFVPLIAGIAEA